MSDPPATISLDTEETFVTHLPAPPEHSSPAFLTPARPRLPARLRNRRPLLVPPAAGGTGQRGFR